MPKTLDELVNERRDAAVRLHWHLSRAAWAVLGELDLGRTFDGEMLAADRARKDWHVAQAGIMAAERGR